jgi:large subunit ribosomal protein L4
VFGPKPRSYAFDLPKKAYRAALRAALTAKASAGDLIVVDLTLSEMKTKELVRLLSQVGVSGKALLVVEQGLLDLIRIGKNVKFLKVLHARDLNVYDLLWCEKLVVSRVELEQIQEVWV